MIFITLNCRRQDVVAVLVFTVVLILFGCSYAYSQTYFTEVSVPVGIAQQSPTWGVTWTDFNNDGLEDLYVNNHHYFLDNADVLIPPALYLNTGNLTFQDVTTSSGIILQGDFHGATWGDFNNDGYPDLFQTQGSGRQNPNGAANRLYKNSESGVFVEIAQTAGVEMSFRRGRGGFWIDYNADGLLDLFICNEKSQLYPSTLMKNNGNETFTEAGLNVFSANMGSPVDFNNDNKIDIFLMSRDRVGLFQNNGTGLFTEVSQSAGLSGITSAQSFAWGDYDNDGDMDLYIARGMFVDTFQWDASGINFTSIVSPGEEKGLDFSVSGTTVTFDIYNYLTNVDPTNFYIGASGYHPLSFPFTLAVGDPLVQGKPAYNNRAKLAYYVWEEAGQWHLRSTTKLSNKNTINFFNGIVKTDGLVSTASTFAFEFAVGDYSNMLFENTGAGTFVEVALQAGVADASESIASVWSDFDNDGFLDLYVVNLGDISNKPNRLFMNNGNKTFTDKAVLSGVDANVVGRGESAATGDYDNNGFMDIALSNGFGTAPFSFGSLLLYHNVGNANHWLKVKLVGKRSNRDAVGARVTAAVGQTTYTREQNGSPSRFSQSSQVVHFGLGARSTIDVLTVYWPSGVVQTIKNISADQELVVIEPSVRVDMVPEKLTYVPGETLRYQVTLTNETNLDMGLSFWTNVTTPGGGAYPITGELFNPQQVQLLPLGTTTAIIRHDIPLNAVSGLYRYHGLAGPYPLSWSEGSFAFTVQP